MKQIAAWLDSKLRFFGEQKSTPQSMSGEVDLAPTSQGVRSLPAKHERAAALSTAAPTQDPLRAWNTIAGRTLASVAITLLMLTIVVLGFIGVLSLVDILRRQVLGRLSTSFETILGGPVLASIVTTAKVADSANLQPLRNCNTFSVRRQRF